MKFVLTGGGTAGHINPALALAEVLAKRNHEVYFAGTPQGVEARLVGQTDIPFMGFEAAGFDRERPHTLLTSSLKILRSQAKARSWMKELSPDVVVGFGGYVSIPVGMAAEKLGIPLVVHEQNSVMGMANKYLGKKAAAVALTYEVAGKDIAEKSKLVLTGNPVRSSVFSATREQGREMLGIDQDATLLLVFGGSLGARHINSAVSALKDRLLAVEGLHVVHISGPKEYETTLENLALSPEEERRWTVMPYQDRMAETLHAADCVISRAGATSLAEISALGLPALLVPFPYATEDHQTTNARAYVESGAADMIADAELDSERFADKLLTLVSDPCLRASMSEAAARFETQDAASKLADVVVGAARRA